MYRRRRIETKAICAYAVFGLLILLLQTTFARLIAIGAIAPMLLIPAAACVGMQEGERVGAVFGLVLGFLCDATVGALMCYYALLLLAVGYFAGKMADGGAGAGIIPLYVIELGTYVASILLYLLYTVVVVGNMGGFGSIIGIYFYEFLYSVPFAAGIYFLSEWIHIKFGDGR